VWKSAAGHETLKEATRMITRFTTWVRVGAARYVGNERGQDIIVLLLVLFVIWLLLTGGRVVVQ